MVLLFSTFTRIHILVVNKYRFEWVNVPSTWCMLFLLWPNFIKTCFYQKKPLGVYFNQDWKLHIQIEAPGSVASRLIQSIIAPSSSGGIADVAGLVFTVLICHSVREKGKSYTPVRQSQLLASVLKRIFFFIWSGLCEMRMAKWFHNARRLTHLNRLERAVENYMEWIPSRRFRDGLNYSN